MLFVLFWFALIAGHAAADGIRHASDVSLLHDTGVFKQDATLLFDQPTPTGLYALARDRTTCDNRPIPGRPTPYRVRVQQPGNLSIPWSSLNAVEGNMVARGLTWYTCIDSSWHVSPCAVTATETSLVAHACTAGTWALVAAACDTPNGIDCSVCIASKGCYCNSGPNRPIDIGIAVVVVLLFILPRIAWTILPLSKHVVVRRGLELAGYYLALCQALDSLLRWTSPAPATQHASVALMAIACAVATVHYLLTDERAWVDLVAMALFDASVSTEIESMQPTANVRAWSNTLLWFGLAFQILATFAIPRVKKTRVRTTLLCAATLFNAVYLVPFLIEDCDGRPIAPSYSGSV